MYDMGIYIFMYINKMMLQETKCEQVYEDKCEITYETQVRTS